VRFVFNPKKNVTTAALGPWSRGLALSTPLSLPSPDPGELWVGRPTRLARVRCRCVCAPGALPLRTGPPGPRPAALLPGVPARSSSGVASAAVISLFFFQSRTAASRSYPFLVGSADLLPAKLRSRMIATTEPRCRTERCAIDSAHRELSIGGRAVGQDHRAFVGVRIASAAGDGESRFRSQSTAPFEPTKQ
jgi:hypothetical protein